MGNYTAVYDTEDITELSISGMGQVAVVVVGLVALITLIAVGTWMWKKGKAAVK